MKKITILALTLFSLLSLSAQEKKLSLYGIAQNWRDTEYVLCAPGGNTHDVSVCMDCFAHTFVDNPMLQALASYFTGDSDSYKSQVAEFKLDMQNGYVKIRMKSKDLVETEGKFWALPNGKEVFVVKMINPDEDTLPRIFFFDVINEEGVMKPAREPDGLNYGFADNFILPRTGNSIEVFSEYYPSDHIVLKDGVFVYQDSAPNAISCYLSDPDPSGITNVRDAPGGKIIARLGEKLATPVAQTAEKATDEEEEYVDWPEEYDGDSIFMFSIYNPRNGWWQIHAKIINGTPVENEAWIHYSVLEMRTRNYGGQSLNLYKEPSADSPVVAVIRDQEAGVRPMDMSPDGEWTKVKAKAGTGWIETKWLCGNPYTTCP